MDSPMRYWLGENMDIKDVNIMAKLYSDYLWDIETPLTIIQNNRLKATYAQFWEDRNTIEFSKITLNQNEYIITDILLHELCHWWCFYNGKNNDDGDADFENELKLLQACPTNTYVNKNEKLVLECHGEYFEYVPSYLVKVLVKIFRDYKNR